MILSIQSLKGMGNKTTLFEHGFSNVNFCLFFFAQTPQRPKPNSLSLSFFAQTPKIHKQWKLPGSFTQVCLLVQFLLPLCIHQYMWWWWPWHSLLWDNGNEIVGFFVWRVFSGFESVVFKSLFYLSLWVWWWLNHFVSWENVVFHEGDCFGCMFLILVGWLSWLDVLYFYKTHFLILFSLVFARACVYIYIFVLGGGRHKMRVKIHIFSYF